MTKEERNEYQKRWNKTPKGIAAARRASQKRAKMMREEGFKFNARNYSLHIDKLNKQKRKVGALAELIPNHYRQNGRIQYI